MFLLLQLHTFHPLQDFQQLKEKIVKKKKLTSNYLYYRELTLLFYCGRETDTVSVTMLTLVICLSTKEFPEVFGCVGMGIYSFFYSLYIRSSTAKFPLCLN